MKVEGVWLCTFTSTKQCVIVAPLCNARDLREDGGIFEEIVGNLTKLVAHTNMLLVQSSLKVESLVRPFHGGPLVLEGVKWLLKTVSPRPK